MVRLLHFSDLHLGVGSYGRFDPQIGLSSRMVDFLSSLDHVVDHALENEIHLVVFAGDAYKTCDPTPTLQREFAQRIGHLAKADVPTVLLPGNHDVPHARGRANSVAIFTTLGVNNVHVPNEPTTLRLETESGPIQVVALPWLGRSLLTSRDDHKNKTMDEIRETILGKAESIVMGLIENLDPVVPTVFLAHASVFGAAHSSERRTAADQGVVLNSSFYTHSAFDYVALGHVHKHQVLHDSPPVVYSGSLERIDFGEEEEEKGFVVAEVTKGKAEYEFVPTPARRFLTIRVRATGKTPMDDVARTVADHDVRDAVVRMIIQTTAESEPLIDDKACRQLLTEAFHVAAIVREVKRSRRVRLGRHTTVESLSPRELLTEYFEYREVEPDRMGLLLEHADRLMAEIQ